MTSVWDKIVAPVFRPRISSFDLEKVTRFEVIEVDGRGRAYVQGTPYGPPIEVELQVQDEGRTLKAFVKNRAS